MRSTILVAALVAATLPAQRGGMGNTDASKAWQQLARQYDADKDGRITAEELGRGERAFTNLDRDRDGAITAADFERRRGGRNDMSRMIAQRLARAADADGDRKVTGAEWKRFLAGLDISEKGVVSAADIAERIGMRPGRGGGRGNRGRGPDMGRMIVRLLDTDGSDAVELAEIESLFGKADADGDGVVAGDELGRDRGARRPGGRRADGAPKKGDPAPDFELPFAAVHAEGKEKGTVRLSSFAGKKPVALIFGSYT